MITIYANWTGNALATGTTLDDARAKLTPLDCLPDTVFGTDATDVTALDTGPHIIIPPQPDRYDLLHKARPHFAVVAAEGPARLTRQHLVYEATGKPVLLGDEVTIHGLRCVVAFYRAPHKAGSEGKVTVHVGGSRTAPVEYYVSIIGARWIDREDRPEVAAGTYTLAIGGDMLLATVPDGGDIEGAVAREMQMAGARSIPDHETITGCILTDDEPEDADRIVWHSGNAGWIADETDRVWRFAIRAETASGEG
jgi:hypothetical protein